MSEAEDIIRDAQRYRILKELHEDRDSGIVVARCAEDLAFWLRQALLDTEDQETEDRACEALKMFEEAKHVD